MHEWDEKLLPASIAELKIVSQPDSVRGRKNAEHWSASVYLRKFSPFLTMFFLRRNFTANRVTSMMILAGWATALCLLIPGAFGIVFAVIFCQLQMLIDCCDGEVARWRKTSSPAGIFLDKVGHYTTEALIPIMFGLRAAGYDFEGHYHFEWLALGALLAVVIVINKALNDMVHVARAHSGVAKLQDTRNESAPRQAVVARLRRIFRFLPFHRIFHSVELTLLIAACSVLGFVFHVSTIDRLVLIVLLPLSLLAVSGHFVSIMASSKVK